MDHQSIALDEIARCAAAAEAAGLPEPPIRVTWDLRGLTAGVCRYDGGPICHLRFNAHIAQAEGDAYRQTVAHEYAHAIVYVKRLLHAVRYGMAPRGAAWSAHGDVWRSVMRTLGREPKRCHAYRSAERAVERRDYAYRCDCAIEHRISIVRHRKIVAGTARYRCARCRGVLRAV